MSTQGAILEGARAVVTGAGDIGGTIASELARRGATVEAWDRSAEALARLETAGVRTRRVEVTSPADVGSAVDTVWRELGGVEVLVNTAAVATFGSVAEMSLSQWQETIDVNLTGVFVVCQAFVPYLVSARGGSIVNISSIGGLRGEPEFAHYCASKFGVIGFSQSLAREIGVHNVRVNCVCPGAVESRMNTETMARDARRLELTMSEIEQRIIERTALRRLVEPTDVADAVVFLASDLASMITGETISVTGGVF